MKNLYTLILLLSLSYASWSQGSIYSSVLDENSEPIPFANVALYTAIDSTIHKLEYTQEDGTFSFKNVGAGEYWITTSFVGYNDLKSETFSLNTGENKELESFSFVNGDNTLSEVTVTAKRPLLEMKPDKVVVNVAGSINAIGEDAFSLLKKSPGIVVDNNDNILMLGKSGVQVYINGKPSPLSSSDLAAYLKTLSSDQIDQIEVITNPSAKYDAQGSAGIINIKLLRNKNHGANGNINANYNKGTFSRGGISFNGTYRSEKWYLSTSMGMWKGASFEVNDLFRVQSGLQFDQDNLGEGSWHNQNIKLGVDYSLDKRSTIGAQVFFSPGNNGTWDNAGTTRISQFMSTTEDSILVSQSMREWESDNWSANLNYQYSGEKGNSLNIDADYARYNTVSEELQPNFYWTPDSLTRLSENIFFTQTPREIKISTLKADYETQAWGGQLSFGAKYSNVLTDNIFDFYNVINNQNFINRELSNQFEYSESVTAAYVSFNKKMGVLNVQTGLRMEQTESRGTLLTMTSSTPEEVKRSYLDFFPNIGIGYQLDEKNTFNISYSRRLNRPSYEDLNPFTSRLDELTFEKGNPFLNPEYSNNIQVSHSWNYKLNTRLGYTHTTDQITRLVDQADDKSAFITWLNLESQKSYSINVGMPIPVTNWWNTYTSLTGVYTRNQANFEGEKIIDLSAKTFNAYMQHTFTLPKGVNFEFSGWYTSPSIWGGNIKMDAMYSMDMGVSKSFLLDKLNIKLSMSDVFNTQRWRGNGLLGDFDLRLNGRGDNQRGKISVKYRFGNQNVKNKSRKTGIEAETNRIKGEG